MCSEITNRPCPWGGAVAKTTPLDAEPAEKGASPTSQDGLRTVAVRQ